MGNQIITAHYIHFIPSTSNIIGKIKSYHVSTNMQSNHTINKSQNLLALTLTTTVSMHLQQESFMPMTPIWVGQESCTTGVTHAYDTNLGGTSVRVDHVQKLLFYASLWRFTIQYRRLTLASKQF